MKDTDNTESGESTDQNSMVQSKSWVENLVENFIVPPPKSSLNAWMLGFLAPIPAIVFGLYCVITERVPSNPSWYRQVNRIQIESVTGGKAIIVGCAFICIGLFCHFYGVWYNRRPAVGTAGMLLMTIVLTLLLLLFVGSFLLN